MMSFSLDASTDALFLDIDGTLLDIAPAPHAVVVPAGLKEQLTRLQEKLGNALALISGRSIDDIDRLFKPLRLPAAGSHGAQWRTGAQMESAAPLPDSLRRAIREELSGHSALIIEDKKYSMAVHYRNAPGLAGEIEDYMESLLGKSLEPLSLMCGKMVCEIIRPGYDKGTALEHFMKRAPFAGRRPVFLGDDETDLFAIRACRRLGGVGIGVGHAHVTEHAFSSPRDVRKWLEAQAA